MLQNTACRFFRSGPPANLRPKMKTLRILIADSNSSLRGSLHAFLDSHVGWKVCGEAVDGWDAIEKVATLKPDVILLDTAMPNLNGIEAARIIHKNFPASEILMVSEHEFLGPAKAALDAGACAYITRLQMAQYLMPAIEAVSKHMHVHGAEKSARRPRTWVVMSRKFRLALVRVDASEQLAAIASQCHAGMEKSSSRRSLCQARGGKPVRGLK
jgi:DNA-binding NarL/FixJ family response regulator